MSAIIKELGRSAEKWKSRPTGLTTTATAGQKREVNSAFGIVCPVR